jgi:hypothetical protein
MAQVTGCAGGGVVALGGALKGWGLEAGLLDELVDLLGQLGYLVVGLGKGGIPPTTKTIHIHL